MSTYLTRKFPLTGSITAGAINTTAQDIQVFRRKPKPPPTLKDVMNPAIGDKMLDTQNQFQQEWLLGKYYLSM